jgi:hypothetical protein
MNSSSYVPELWQYTDWQGREIPPFGDATTYITGLSWLYETCDDVEDWGAGMAYGRRFCPEGKRYFAIDGSPSSAPFVDLVINLREYEPLKPPEGIFMRHVLEHNLDWREILEHALAAFTKRFCLVLFTPFSVTGQTYPLRALSDDYRDLAFHLADLTREFRRVPDLRWHMAALQTNTQYGWEQVFYLSKEPDDA